jgi:carboxypeptidase Q
MLFRRSTALARLSLVTLLGASLFVSQAHTQTPASADWLDPYREAATSLIQASTSDDFAWQRVAELTDTYGHRLSGSANLEQAIAWAVETMASDGLEHVRAEPVMVPRWVRGAEHAEFVSAPQQALTILGLGGSVGTPPDGVEGDVLVVNSFAELRARGRRGREDRPV